MFVRVIEGRIRFVIVNRAVVLVMVVVDALIVLQLMDERDRVCDRRQAALHGETIHGQAQQQEDVDNPTQGNHRENFANYSSCFCCYGQGYVAIRGSLRFACGTYTRAKRVLVLNKLVPDCLIQERLTRPFDIPPTGMLPTSRYPHTK